MRTIPGPKIIGAISPPPYAQPSPPKPEVEGAQSPPAAHRDDSLATNPSAGLVTEDHPPTRRRGGWGRAGVVAGAACLAWLAWPNLAFAQVPGVTISETELTVPEGGSASYTVVLATQPTDDVTITVARSSGDDENLTASPDALTFTNSNWSMQQTVTILATEDADSENGTALFTHAVASPDTAYEGLPAPGVTATENDNDTAGVIVSPTTLSVPEGGSATYTVVLETQPTADVTITVARSPSGDDDLTASPDTLTFTNSNWSMQQTVTILAAEDDDGEAGVAAFNHSAASPDTAYEGLPAPGVRATENDNDTAGVIVSPTTLSVPEGGSATYTVRLGTEPLYDVTVLVTRDQRSDADLTVSSDTDTDINTVTLPFTKSNWNTEQTVTVTAAEDADEVDDVAIFSHGTASFDDDYYPLDVDSVTATEADNDKDQTRPRVAITTEASAPVGGAFEVTIRFSENVRGFTLRDIGVSNGTASKFNRVSSRSYTVTITPEESGEVRVEVRWNVARDGAGNGNRAAEPLVIEADLERPEVTIAGPTEPVGMAGFEVTITFSEPVEGFELEDIRVTNGTASNFTKVSPQEYTAEITPSASGGVKMEVAEDVARDGAGNGNRAAEPLVIEADLERPEVTIAGPTEPVGMAGFEVTITFSEPVEGFELEDIRVTNGTASNFTKVSPQEYTAEITPSASGGVKMEVAEDVARDGAGNGNRAAEPLVIEADLERPEVTIAGPTEPVGMAGFEVTITFSEPVEGFELEDIRVTNGTASNFTKVSPQEYTAEITPSASGAVKMEVAEDVARDGAGNGNRAAGPLVIEADLERPEVTIAGPTEPVGMAGFEVTITFSEPVEGFELEDIRVTNGTASNFTKVSPQEYTAEITPSASGAVKMEVAEDVARDGGGNGNRAAEPLVIEADLERPEVTIAGPTEPVGMAGFEVTITFSEPVEGFELEDIRVTNGTASNFTKVSPQEYTAEITPSASGAVKMEVAEDVARDGGGNGNRAAEPLVIEADLERPEVTIAGPTEPVGMAGFEVTITFSEPVEGFELEDIRVTNGTASNFTKVSPQEYTATITPEEIGEVRVEVPEEVAEDGAGNGNRAAEPLVIEADLERPEVTIAGPTEPVGMAGFEVTITFSEPVEGFELEDIRVTNGTASNFTKVSPQEYTAEITPSASGAVKMEVAEDVARDGGGNGNRAAEPLVIEADLERPEVTIAGPTEPVGMAGFEVTITFSEPVEGFELEDIRVTNGTASNFTKVSPQEYTATITPEEIGEVRVEVPEEVAEDGAGNGNRAAEPLVIEADLERPEVTIAGPTEPVGMAGFEVTITFSEPVEGFELEDIRVTNGTASNFTKVSPQEYTATITPEEIGEVRVEVPEEVAEDGAGNGNRAAEPLVIEADLERPEVTIAGPTEPVGMAGFEVTITFSEPVEGFELEDIRVTNGTASNFTKVSPQEYTAEITPSASGAVKMEVAEDVARDGGGNGNQAAEAFELETKLAVSYQEESYTAREGGETVTVTVKLSQGWDEELVIPIRVTRPETTEVADYTLDGLEEWDAQEGTGTLTFQAEETEQILRIAANHDGDGDDETVELGFGELPEIVMAGEPAVATVTLEDKGLVELKVSFGQTEYQIREGQQADIEVTVSPAADRRVEVPLVMAPKGGATDEDYSGVPSKVVFEEGESQGTISVAVLADEVNDPGEGIVLSLGELPEAVRAGEIPETTVNFTQQRTAEQFSQTLEVALAVMARSMGESAQTAIEGRFERHRQWSRLGAVGGAVPTAQPGSDNSATGLGEGESQRIGSESLEGAGRRIAEGPVVPSAGGAAGARAAMGSSGESGDRESGVQGAWLQNVSLGGLAGLFGYGQGYAGVSTGSGRGPSGTGPTVGLGGQPGYGQNRFQGSGTRNSSLRSGSGEYSGRRNQELNLAGVSLELPLAGQEKGTSRSWVPALWGQGDLTRFNGNLTRYEMSYRGGLEAAHVGLDLYANDKVLAGLSFMRSWGNMDYSDDGIDGVLGSRMNTFHPYLYWQPTERVSVWGMGGLGRGQVDVNEPGRSHDFEADFRMFSGGVRTVLSRRGSNEVGLRADAFSAQLETDASGDIGEVRGEAHRARLMLEWVHDRELSVGRSLSLKAEAGGRFDGGDADRGSGVETGFRLGYLDTNSGLDVAMHGRVLVVHASDYRDWGLGVQASWDPGEKQRGFRVSVTSTRGQDGGGRTTLWNNANMVTRPVGMDAMGMGSQNRMESEVAYGGMKALGLPGLLTPYSRLRWAGQGRELAWGTAWSLPPHSQLALPLMLEMEAMRRETRTSPADLAVLLRMSIPF